MKLKFSKMLLLFAAIALINFTGCKKKEKDVDIKAAIESALRNDPMKSGAMIDVTNGIATISGNCIDEANKASTEKIVAGIKGVKSVVNNCSVAPPPPPIATDADAVMVMQGITDALKDQPGVKGSLVDGKIVLTGEITKAKWMMVKQTLDKLRAKGYELSGLTIK